MTNIKPFEDLEFSDDFIFYKVMQDKDACKGIIERLLQIKIDHIEYPELQKTIQPYYTTKGVRLDVYVKDSDKVFNVEMQNRIFPELGKRARYYQSMIDIDSLLKGQDYSELPESYVLFICNQDPIGDGRPRYNFITLCKQDRNLQLNDKIEKVFYNVKEYKKEEDPELKAFLNFVCTSDSTDSFTTELKTLVSRLKQAESNKTEYMSMNLHDQDIQREAREKALKEGERIGEEKGALQKAIEDTKLVISKYNIPVQQACADFGITPEMLSQSQK